MSKIDYTMRLRTNRQNTQREKDLKKMYFLRAWVKTIKMGCPCVMHGVGKACKIKRHCIYKKT